MDCCDNIVKVNSIHRKIPDPSEPLPCQRVPCEEKLLPQIMTDISNAYPTRVAIEYNTGSINYNKLNQLVAGLAAVLLQEGVKKDQTVFICSDRTPLIVVTVLAVLKAGASFTLLDPDAPVDYLHECIQIVNPSVWINLNCNSVNMDKEDALRLNDLIRLNFRVSFNLFSIVDIENLIKSRGIIENNISFPRISGDDTATLTFTSGSSGSPKAVMGRYSSLSHFQKWMHLEFNIGQNDRFAMCSNLSHDPIQRDIFTPIYFGATVIIPSYQDIFTPGQLARWMVEKQLTVCCLTPPMCQFLTTYNSAEITLNCLRKIFFVGASLLKKQVESLQNVAPNADIINLYGSTETQRAVSYFKVPHNLEGFPDVIPIGQGMKDVDILIVNQSTGQLCNFEEVGEIWVRSPYIAKGYLNAPNNHAFAINSFSSINCDRVYKTGDLGMYSHQFGVQCLGRIDDQIKIDGHRVEPSQVDNMLMQYKKIKNAITLAVPNKREQLVLVSFLVTEPGGEKYKNEIGKFLEKHLPKYMLPKRIILINEIPLTKNGKTNYNILKAQAIEEFDKAAVANTIAISLTAEKLAFLAAEISDTPVSFIDINIPLDKLGFTSLNYMELLNSIMKTHNVTLPSCTRILSITEIIKELSQNNQREIISSLKEKNKHVHNTKILGENSATLVDPTHIEIKGRKLLHFCSNSYLGLGQHPLVRKSILDYFTEGHSINSHGAMALNGKTVFHEQLLEEIRQLYDCDVVKLFNSAYMANISIIPALAEANDHVIVDSSSHKSIIDGCTLSQAHFYSFRHNDMEHLEKKLSALQDVLGNKIIITEGLFSMEGDMVDLPKIRQLADKYCALLMVDEACSLGQLGTGGAGIESHFNLSGAIDFRIGTLSKAIPSVGGYVATTSTLLQKINLRRGSIFSGAIPPIQARIATQAFKILKNERGLVEKLKVNCMLWRLGLENIGLNLLPGESAIVTIKTSNDEETEFLHDLFYRAGIYVFPAISPWNAKDKSIIRTSVTAMHSSNQIEKALNEFDKLYSKLSI